MSERPRDGEEWEDVLGALGEAEDAAPEAGEDGEGLAPDEATLSGWASGRRPVGRRSTPAVPGRPGGLEHEARGSRADLVTLTASQRLLILDSWLRSGLSAPAFAPLVGVSVPTLYWWKKKFDEDGPAGLEPRPAGTPRGSRMEEATKRAVLMLKASHPEWGCERLHLVLLRSAGHAASPNAIARVLKEAGYAAVERAPSRHAPVERRFERARVNQLWQTDLFTFLVKRENRRVYLVAFMDDRSRFVVSWGLHASASGKLVQEAFEAGVANFGAPEELLTDQGPQYYSWRGKSQLTQLLERRGIRHLVARAHHPQTLGKIERFWGSLWRECLQGAVLRSLDEARRRVGLYIDHHNFHRPHQGIDGMVPADRFFESAPEVLATLKARVSPKAGEWARHGEPRKSFYLTGRVGDAGIALHAEGERIVLTREDGTREEVDLGAPGRRVVPDTAIAWPEVVTPGVDGGDDDDDGTDDGEYGDGAAEDAATGGEDGAGRGDGGERDGEEDGGGDPGGAGGPADDARRG